MSGEAGQSGGGGEQAQAQAEPAPAPSSQTPETDLRGQERQEGWAVPIDRVSAFTAGAQIAVAPERIEPELMSLWRQAAERARRDTKARFAVARACLWNAVIHSRGEDEFQRNKRLIDEVSESVPARIIALFETGGDGSALPLPAVVGDDGEPLRAYVEANFRKTSSGRREVVAEEITLEVPERHGHRLPGLVRGLLLPDVPTALFVRNPALLSRDFLQRIASECDRVIFDSGTLAGADELVAAGQVLGQLSEDAPAAAVIEVADLGWLRLWPWRMLLASMFDTREAQVALRRVSEIRIEYAEGAEPAALLLAGWLLGRIKKRARTLQLVPVSARKTPAGIDSVTLRAGDVEFSARGAGSCDTRTIELTSPFQPSRMQPVHGRPDPELLVAALGVGGRDPLMYEALRLGTQLVHGGKQT